MQSDPQFARSEVLRMFNHYQVYLCLGAAITTVGLIAGSLWGLRRRRDPIRSVSSCRRVARSVGVN